MSDTTTRTPRPASRRRLATWLGVTAAALVVLAALVVFVLPTPLARYILDAQLSTLGIQHDGIDSVRVDLWNSRVRAGPLGFRSGDARQGRLGEAGFDYSLRALLDGRALVQTFFLRGVDLFVARLEDGAIAINGVNLNAIAGPGGEDASQDPDPPAFDFGVGRFEFTDSKLVFEDVTGGSLEVAVDRLTLERLLTWAADEPTTFTLDGRINDMQLSLGGTLQPLSDPLRLTLDSRLRDVTIDGVARFVGPTGLARQDGRLESQARYDYVIHRDGRVEGTFDGSYQLADLSIETTEGDTLTLADARLKADLAQDRLADGSASATGRLQLDGSSLALASASGDSLNVATVGLAFADLTFEKSAERRERVWEPTLPPPATGDGSTAVASLIDLMLGWVRELARNALGHQLEIDGAPVLTLEDGVLRTGARGESPAREIRFDRLTVDLGKVDSRAFDAGWSMTGGLDAAIEGLRLTAPGPGPQVRVQSLEVDSRTIGLSVTTGTTTLELDLAATLRTLTADDGDAGSVSLRALSLASDGIRVEQSPATEEATGPVVLKLEGLEAVLPGAGGVATQVRAESLDLALSPLSLTGRDAEAARLTGNLEATGLGLERGGAEPLSVTIASAATDLEALEVAPLDATARITGGLAGRFSALALALGAGPQAYTLSLDRLQTRLERLDASGFAGAAPTLSAAGVASLSALRAAAPIGDGRRAEATVASLDAPITELRIAGEAVRGAGSLEAVGLSAKTTEPMPQSIDIATLSVTGLEGGGEGGVILGRIALGKTTAALTAPPRGAPGAPEDTAGAPAGPTEGRERLRIGELSVAAGSRLDITDGNVKPPLRTSIVFQKLEAGPLDTAQPQVRTRLALAASMDENTRASVNGWASPLAPEPSFELQSSIDALSLPLISPYAAAAVGIDIESGQLSAKIDSDAVDGQLEGNIDLRIADLFVVPVSEQSAQALQASIGVPVGFAVGILKDTDGVIAFGLPLSGSLDDPKVDYSEAISKAIGGAMASVFPTSWFGPGGNTFDMKPATFAAGTTRLTADGQAVADQIAALFAARPGVSVRACGRAARDDLVALRGAPTPAPGAAADVPGPPPAGATGGRSDDTAASAEPAPTPLAQPSEKEVEALLALATARGDAVRRYLKERHGIDPGRLPQCRTAYGIEDQRPPRAEFQF